MLEEGNNLAFDEMKREKTSAMTGLAFFIGAHLFILYPQFTIEFLLSNNLNWQYVLLHLISGRYRIV